MTRPGCYQPKATIVGWDLNPLGKRAFPRRTEILRLAKYFAQRVVLEAGYDPRNQVKRAFEIALSRPPRESEALSANEFLESTPTGLVDLCQTLFNLNEFLYRQ